MLLIVGATGFIGSNLKEYLHKHDVLYKECSLRGGVPDKLDDDIDTVIYLVGKAHDTRNKAELDIYNQINVNLTMRFFAIFQKSNAKRFIYTSSIKAVCDGSTHPVEENMIPQPDSVYGRSKLEAERKLQERFEGTEKELIILRPAMVHGPNNKGNLNALFTFVKRRMPYPFAQIRNKRSLLSVENFCFVVKEIYLRKGFRSGTYHLADNIPLSTVEILEEIEKTLGIRIWKFQIPTALLRLMLVFGRFSGGLFNQEKLDKLTGSFVVSNTKIKNELGQEFFIDTREGLQKTFRSFKIKQ